VIVIHGNQTDHVPDAYRRYLVNVYRKAFDLMERRAVIFKGETNPFAGGAIVDPRQSKSASGSSNAKR